MSDDGSAQGAVWPSPKFYFNIDLGDGKPQGFPEISGLESEVKTIQYRHGDSNVFSPNKMPGLRSVGNVTLKKGVFTKDSVFWEWFNETKLNTVKRRTVIINLLNEASSPMMTWTLINAFAVKIQATDLKSDANEVEIETLEIACETLAVKATCAGVGAPR